MKLSVVYFGECIPKHGCGSTVLRSDFLIADGYGEQMRRPLAPSTTMIYGGALQQAVRATIIVAAVVILRR